MVQELQECEEHIHSLMEDLESLEDRLRPTVSIMAKTASEGASTHKGNIRAQLPLICIQYYSELCTIAGSQESGWL